MDGTKLDTIEVGATNNQYFSASDLAISITTSTTFQNKITLTDTFDAADYEIGVSYNWNYNSGNSDFEAEFVFD